MAGQESADRVAAAHDRAGGECRGHRLVTGEQVALVRDGEHRPVDDDAGEVHRAVRRGVHRRIRCAHIDAAVSGGVPRRRGEERTQDGMRRGNGPLPRPGGGLCGGRRQASDAPEQHHHQDRE